MGKVIYLLMGKSGSGKSTICRWLHNDLGKSILKSYTERRPRGPSDNGHIFVDEFTAWREVHQSERLVGLTFFDENVYWATEHQANENDVYEIDPSGAEFFKSRYHAKVVKTIYLKASAIERFRNMLKRGDGWKNAVRRILHDFSMFGGAKRMSDVVICGRSPDKRYEKLKRFITSTEEAV